MQAKFLGGVAVVGSLFVLGTMLGSWYTVDAGETAVLTRNGAVVETAGPGLHWKTPWIDTANIISNQDHTIRFKDMQLHTKDQQPVAANISITYQVHDAAKLYALFQTQDNLEARIINVQAPNVASVIFGKYDAAGVVSEADLVNAALTEAIRSAVTEAPITVKSAQVETKVFSEAYTNAIQAQKTAEVQTLQANAEKARRITQADAAAYEVRAKADAEAHQTEVLGDAAAKAIKARGDALKSNPNLVELTAAERWNGQLPTQMIPGNAVPFVSIGK